MGDTKVEDSSGQGAYAFGAFVVDPLKRRLWRDGTPVPITSKTFDVLVGSSNRVAVIAMSICTVRGVSTN